MNKYDKISFRDPSGFVFEKNNNILRGIKISEQVFFKDLFSAPWYLKFVKENKIQDFNFTDEIKDSDFFFLKHKKFHIPVKANDFCSEQLYLGGLLTLDIAIEALKNNIILKDASAWNIFYNTSQPTLCDVTSFEKWDGLKNWYAYGQFARHFIIPLIIFKHCNINVSKLFQIYTDGVKPEEAAKIIGLKSLFNISSIETIFLPSLFHTKKIDLSKTKEKSIEQSETNKKVLLNTMKRLKRYVYSLKPSSFKKKDKWSGYSLNREHYSYKDIAQKRKFIEDSISRKSSKVLDLTCNDGEFSFIAEKLGSFVLAADNDEMSLVRLQSKLTSENIVVCNLDLLNPTPQSGFNNQEHKSFIDKAKSYFDNVFFLGIVHHLFITNKIPLDSIIDFLFNLTNDRVVFELVDKNDKKFIELSKQIKNVNNKLDQDYFERAIKNKFKIIKFEELPDNKRKLYILEKNSN